MVTPSDLQVELHVTGPFQENTYILRCPRSRQVAVVDPGQGIETRVRELMEVEGEQLAAILLTHAHLDHIWGLGALHALVPEVPLGIHPDEVSVYNSFAEQSQLFGLGGMVQTPPNLESLGSQVRWLREGESFPVGESELFVFESPGHSPGSICFYWGEAGLSLDPQHPVEGIPALVANNPEGEGACLVGDVVLSGSVGRTDLPGSNHEHLMRTLRRRIHALPPQTHLLGGHGEPSQLADELRINPFLQQALREGS